MMVHRVDTASQGVETPTPGLTLIGGGFVEPVASGRIGSHPRTINNFIPLQRQ